MNLDSINKWLMFAANIGVLIGIIFLAVEIEQNSVVNKVSSIQAIRQGMQNVNFLAMENKEFAALHEKLANNEQLDQIETQQMWGMTNYMVSQSKMAFYHYQNDLISDDDLLEMVGPLLDWIGYNESIRGVWNVMDTQSEGEFYNYINSVLADR